MKNLKMNLLITLLFAVFTLAGVLHHEIWADEAQVWLLVKNLSVKGLFSHLVNEGHPSFFYLLNMPFAKAGFSIFAMQLLCWLGTVFGVFMILRFSPFNKFAKFSIITSAGFIYFFPVIARSYSILPFLITAAAYFYTKKEKYPLIYAVILALCANTHVIMSAFVFVLGVYFFFDNVLPDYRNDEVSEKKRVINLVSFGIIAIGLAAVAAQLNGTISSNAAIGFSFDRFFTGASVVLTQFFLNIVDYSTAKSHVVYAPAFWGALSLAVLTVLSFILLLFTNLRAFFLAFFGISFQLLIYIVSYHSYVYPTRIAAAYLIFIFCFWITLENKNKQFYVLKRNIINIVLGLMFLLTFLNGARFYVLDLLNCYSASKNTAQFLQTKLPENSIIMTNNDPFSLGIYYYMPQNSVWSLMKQDYIKYVKWDSSLETVFQKKNWGTIVRVNFGSQINKKNIYVICSSFLDYNSAFDIFPSEDFELIYTSPPSIADGEAFRVYKFTGRI